MTPHFTPELIASMQLQGDFLVLGMQMGLTEEKAREFAEKAIHKLMTSRVVHPNTKREYEAL